MRSPVRLPVTPSGPTEGLHISGVGVIGAFVCWEAHRRQIPFTWDDADNPYNAWEVSTGGIVPYDDDVQSWYALGYRYWRDHLPELPRGITAHLEPAQLIYALKGCPARLRTSKPRPIAVAPAGVQLWPDPHLSYQLNAQEFVTQTRQTFARLRQPAPVGVEQVVHVHCRGVHDEHSRPIPLWGWVLPARLRPTAACAFWPALDAPRLNLHFNDPSRPGERWYFQPVARYTDLWWAGSDRRRQRTPTLEPDLAQTKFKRFQEVVAQTWGTWLEIEYLTDQMGQGWRPEERSKAWKLGPPARWITPTLLVPRPHARNGVQCGPLLAHTLVNMALSSRRPVTV